MGRVDAAYWWGNQNRLSSFPGCHFLIIFLISSFLSFIKWFFVFLDEAANRVSAIIYKFYNKKFVEIKWQQRSAAGLLVTYNYLLTHLRRWCSYGHAKCLFLRTIKSKPSSIYIQTFIWTCSLYIGVTLIKKRLAIAEETAPWQSKSCYFSPMAKRPPAKICCWIFFFLVPQMTWNFYSIFLTCIGRFVGIFDLIHIYLGIEELF